MTKIILKASEKKDIIDKFKKDIGIDVELTAISTRNKIYTVGIAPVDQSVLKLRGINWEDYLMAHFDDVGIENTFYFDEGFPEITNLKWVRRPNTNRLKIVQKIHNVWWRFS